MSSLLPCGWSDCLVAKAMSKSAGPRASTNYEIASPHARSLALCVGRRRHKPGLAIWLGLHPASLPVNPDQDSFISGSGTLRPVILPILPDCAAPQWRV